jgi:hypothetical protein
VDIEGLLVDGIGLVRGATLEVVGIGLVDNFKSS